MRNFRINLIGRILTLSLLIFAAAFFFFIGYKILAVAFTLFIISFYIFSTIRYIDRTNKELIEFLQAINYSDYSIHFNFGNLGKSFKNISDEFNKVLNKFKQSRSEKEESLLYLQTIIEHVGVGVITFDSKGKIDLINRSAKKILKISQVKNLSVLNSISPNFGNYIFGLETGKHYSYKIANKDEIIQLLLFATEFKMRRQIFKLVTLQNIQPEIEKTEIEAYQKLIRVLTHEIMNSVTPISSLASTINLWLNNDNKNILLNDGSLEDLSSAVLTIKKRSEGLVKFVEKYRDLTKIPKPNFEILKISQLFERLKLLMESGLKNSSIVFNTEINPSHLEIAADPHLLEQVLINLLNNAVQSLKSNESPVKGEILLKASIDDRGKALIKVADNGPGISQDIIDKIFIPFFTTKQDGSGIGLSISQQIINAHFGSLSVSSIPNKQTVFTIRL